MVCETRGAILNPGVQSTDTADTETDTDTLVHPYP